MVHPTSAGTTRWTAIAVFLLSLMAGELVAQARGATRPDPLPLEVAVSLRGHNGRSPVNFSPEGAWIAHTVETDGTVPRSTSYAYADTGFPFAEGNARMEATLSEVDGAGEIRLGGPESSSWGPVWSPDGARVAFYSDEGGEAGLWVWERDTATRRRVSDTIVRPFFGFEAPRWASDGERLLVKLLPRGTTLAEANGLLPASGAETGNGEGAGGPNEPAVTVRRTASAAAEWGTAEDSLFSEPADPLARRMAGFAADLAVVDVTTGEVERIVERTPVRMYAFSPDDRHVAYTVLVGAEPNTQQSLFDLRLYDLVTGRDETLAEGIRLRYGIEWSWSPTGRSLAYTRSGQKGDGAYVVISIPDGVTRVLENEAPHFAPGEGEVPPIWSSDGVTLYGVGDGALWTVDPETGAAREIVRVDGWAIRSLLTAHYGAAVAWSAAGSDELWVAAREEEGDRSGLYAIELDTGRPRPALEEAKSWSHIFSQAANSTTGAIAFVSRDQRQPGEIHAFETRRGEARQVSRINEGLARYPLGEARLLRWTSASGEPLAGALLLPPGYEPGTRLPLVVFVYGGARGSQSINRFGLWGSGATFNMHILATRGYAVLYPDAPLEPGRITEDLVATVLPGVDAAIEAGYADPDRLAVMGQSFGSLNTLQLLTRTDRFAAAIITAAVLHPDLATDYLRSTGYYEEGQGNMGGTLWEYPERYRENSPLFDFPAIETPLLIAQGDQDGDLVPAEAIFTALERLEKSVEYRLYGGESHVISGRANVLDLWERRLEFLARHLDLEVDERGYVEAR